MKIWNLTPSCTFKDVSLKIRVEAISTNKDTLLLHEKNGNCFLEWSPLQSSEDASIA